LHKNLPAVRLDFPKWGQHIWLESLVFMADNTSPLGQPQNDHKHTARHLALTSKATFWLVSICSTYQIKRICFLSCFFFY